MFEFKRDLSSVKPILKTLVAFANTASGVLVVLGVDDDKEVIGIDDPLLSEEKLTSLIADHISPTLLPTIKIAAVNNKSLLLIEVSHVAKVLFYFVVWLMTVMPKIISFQSPLQHYFFNVPGYHFLNKYKTNKIT